MKNPALEKLVAKRGGFTAFAQELNVARQTVQNWRYRGLPYYRAVELHERYGVSLKSLLPSVPVRGRA